MLITEVTGVGGVCNRPMSPVFCGGGQQNMQMIVEIVLCFENKLSGPHGAYTMKRGYGLLRE